MTTGDPHWASKQINALAGQKGWPLIDDPYLRFVTPQLATVLAVWQSKRGARTMPARADLTMRDLKTALPNLAFLDIVSSGARMRFKVRLAGGAIDTFLGHTATGRFLDTTVPPEFAEKWSALWRPAISARIPMRTVARIEFPDRRYYMSETFNAPLAGDGENPDILMTVAFFHAREGSGAHGEIAERLVAELGERAAA